MVRVTCAAAGVWIGFCASGIAAWLLILDFRKWNGKLGELTLSRWEWSTSPFAIPAFLQALLLLWWLYCPVVVVKEAQKAALPRDRPSAWVSVAWVLWCIVLGAVVQAGQLTSDIANLPGRR